MSLRANGATSLTRPSPAPRSAGSLFQLLRDGQPRTRADLAVLTGQARPTIASRVDELLAAGFIAPAGEASSTGGRPPATFAFNPSTRLVLAADLGATHARFAVTDLAATILAEESMALPIADGPTAVLDVAAARLRGLVESLGRPLSDVAGVGVGLPGPVEHQRGRAINPPIMPGWDDYDVPAHLAPLLHAPIFVDNDVNIMALGEHAARWSKVDDLVLIKVSSGIGAGIISDGELRRGALGAAGDLGHIAVARGATVPCRCGNTGCLEAIAGGSAVSAALREQGLPVDGPSQIVDLVRAGNLTATQAVRQAGRDLGEVLAGVVNLLNPSVIVIGGTIAEVGEYLLAGIREVVYSRSLPLATQHLRIVPAQTEGRAGVVGAAQMVAQDVLSAGAIDEVLGEIADAALADR